MSEQENKFFVIRKDRWPNNRVKYSIMKETAYSLEEATKMLLAYEQLNDDKDHTYHLNKVDEYLTSNEQPLVLNEEVA
jgi:predicted RNase H-related nuclease YkuK (DUF458 family)